jgi:hypothetical protein
LLRFGSDGSDNEEDAVAVEVRDGAAPPLLGDIVGYAVPSFERVLATAIAELTGDGTPDVAVLTRQLVYVFPGTTGHALGAPAEYELPAGLRDELRIGMDVSDLDGDGHDDVVVTGSGQYSALPFLGVFYQSPEGGLEPVESIATVSSRRVRVADLDGDGRQDLISAELEGATYTLELRRQTSSRVFGPPASLTVTFNDEPGLLQLLVGDVDGNGRTDVLVLAAELGRITGPHLALFLQNGTGGFEPPRFLEDRLMTAFVNAVALGDLDRDGVSEVVVAHGGNRASEWQPYLSIFSEESFDGGGSTDHIDTYDMPSAVVVADLDNDGRSDAIVAHNGFGSLSTHRQGPHGRLFPRLLTPFVLSDTWIPETLTAGDLDRDGAIDVVLGNSYGSIAIAWGEPVDPANMKSLSILVAGDGEGRVTSSPPGIDCGAVCDASFKAGTWVRLRGEAAPGSTFEGWRGHACTTGRDGSCTVVVMNSVVQADFGRSASRLTVNRTGNGSGRVTSDVPGIDCGDDCEEEYRKGWWVTLTAEPGPGFEFGGWSGSDYCTGPPEPSCRVHIEGDKTVSAYFKIPDPTLTVRVTGGQYGEVIFHGAPCRGICEYLVALGDAVYLNANPDPGARFGGWTGACTGFHVCRVVMDQDREVGASFDFPLAFDSTLIPDAETAVVYRAALAARGGTPPYTFALIEGKLPKGLSLSSAGTIAGTPTNAASTSATVEVRDTAGGIAQRGISISVVRAVRVATRELPKGIVGRPYSATLSAKYGRAPMSWRISRGLLPAGLALDGASGQISGTPEAAGNVTLTVQVDDALGGQRRRTLKLKVRVEGQGG